MKKILLFIFLLPTLAFAQLELPFPIKLVNPKPVDFWYFESDGTPYDNTGEVISQVLSAIRYRGMTFNVNGVEYWFKDGITDGDLIVKGPSWSEITSKPTTIAGYGITDFNSLGDARWLPLLGATLTDQLNLSMGTLGELFATYDDDGSSGNGFFGASTNLGTVFRSNAASASSNFSEFYGYGGSLIIHSYFGGEDFAFNLYNSIGTIQDSKASKTGLQYYASGYETTDLTLTSRGFVKDGTYTFTNKSISLGSNTLIGTTAQFNTALTDNDFATLAGSETLTNKSIALGSNSLTGTSNQAVSIVTDPARTVTGTGAIVQADNGRTVYFNSATPFNFTIDALTINSFTMFRNIGAGTVTFVDGSGVTSTGATALLADEVGGIEYIASITPIISKAGGSGGGSGDFVGPASAVDGEAVVFDGTTGKLGKRPTGSAKFPILGLAATTFGANEVIYSSGVGNTAASSSAFTYDGSNLTVDQINGTALRSVNVSISSAEILTLNSSPKTLIAAPGSGKILQILSISIVYTYVSAAYATNTDLEIDISGVDVGYTTISNVINQANNYTRWSMPPPGIQSTADLSNGALTIKTKTGNPTGGGGSMKVLITYNIVTL